MYALLVLGARFVGRMPISDERWQSNFKRSFAAEMPTRAERRLMQACIDGNVPGACKLLAEHRPPCRRHMLRYLPEHAAIRLPHHILSQSREVVIDSIARCGSYSNDCMLSLGRCRALMNAIRLARNADVPWTLQRRSYASSRMNELVLLLTTIRSVAHWSAVSLLPNELLFEIFWWIRTDCL